jgi:hypothetical protein
MLFVRGLSLLLLLTICVLLIDGLVPDRDVPARIEARSALIAAQSGQTAALSTADCDDAEGCARMAALPAASQ